MIIIILILIIKAGHVARHLICNIFSLKTSRDLPARVSCLLSLLSTGMNGLEFGSGGGGGVSFFVLVSTGTKTHAAFSSIWTRSVFLI
jgi:hypothetical protein